MAYRWKKNETAATALRRIADEQIRRSVDDLQDSHCDLGERIHRARQRLKKLRALLRLAGRGSFFEEDRFFRDLSRRLAPIRDQAVIAETAAMLQLEGEKPSPKDCLPNRGEDAIHEVMAALQSARHRVADWTLEQSCFAAFRAGFEKTYRQGRRRWKSSRKQPNSLNLHHWRKAVKYHFYQTRILRELKTSLPASRRNAFAALAELLGQEHDLAVVIDAIHPQIKRSSLKRIARQQKELREQALKLGARLYAPVPKTLSNAVARDWNSRNC